MALSQLNLPDALISKGDPHDAEENRARACVLGKARGYQENGALFLRFPRDVKWTLVELDLDELKGLKYANYSTWLKLTQGTRNVADGAKNVHTVPADDVNGHILALTELILKGAKFPELIIVGNGAGHLVLAEGHTRATALVLAKSKTARAFLGTSTMIEQWHWF